MSKRIIFLADCQSFYASVEKASDPTIADKPVVVAGDPERRSGIILTACPIAKSYGIETAETIRPAIAKCPQLIVRKPRMGHYIEVSLRITGIYERYTDLVEPYSIDEQFLDVTASVRMYGSPEALAAAIQRQVFLETGIRVRIGIGENKVLAKTACDNFAKKIDSGIYTLHKENLKPLWDLPINKMFMVGSRMTQHLIRIGINMIGDLARMDLVDFKRKLRQRMGRQSDIQAELLWRIATGRDDAPVTPHTFDQKQKAVGHMMTLPFDYVELDAIKVVLNELSQMVCKRARSKGQMGWVVSAGCSGADFDNPSGFYKQIKLPFATNLSSEVSSTSAALFDKHWRGYPVRRLAVTLSDLESDAVYQMPLFPADRERKMTLERTTDEINNRFGPTAIMRASSLTPAGQARRRSGMIGGHYK